MIVTAFTPAGVPYPEATDLVQDTDEAIQAVAEAVGGVLGYGQTLANVAGITAQTYLGADVTVTIPAGRRLRLTGHVRINGGAATNVFLGVAVGGANVIYNSNWYATNTIQQDFYVAGILTPAAGTITYRLTLSAAAAVNAINATTPAWLLVEDVGPA